MSHLKTYNIFPDKWAKNWTKDDLNDARLSLKAYITNKDTELGIKEVSSDFYYFFEQFGLYKTKVSEGRMPTDEFRDSGVFLYEI